MSRNFTDCLTMGVKFLEAVKRRLHAIKQWSPDEIRVWQLPLFTYLFSEHHECHCLALLMCSPLSSAKLLVTGKHVILLFSRSVPSPSMCICVYVYYIRCSGCCLYFVLCRRKKEEVEMRVVITERVGRTKPVSYLCFPLISDER